MFINCSNHKFSMWDDAQKNAALKCGEVEDIPFPNVNPLIICIVSEFYLGKSRLCGFESRNGRSPSKGIEKEHRIYRCSFVHFWKRFWGLSSALRAPSPLTGKA